MELTKGGQIAGRLPGPDRQGIARRDRGLRRARDRRPSGTAPACVASSRCSCATRSSRSRRTCPICRGRRSAYLPLGTGDELRAQIVEVALDRAFLAEPLPTDAAAFARRIDEGRGRLVLIADEVARRRGASCEYHAALRKLNSAPRPQDVADDVAQQLERLVTRRFIADTPWERLQHLPRYLKAIAARLDKLRADPARDSARLAELRPLEQRYLRKLAERRGARDARLDEFRWWLEELRVGLFAQELKTPQPVSAKRLDKIWAQAFA